MCRACLFLKVHSISHCRCSLLNGVEVCGHRVGLSHGECVTVPMLLSYCLLKTKAEHLSKHTLPLGLQQPADLFFFWVYLHRQPNTIKILSSPKKIKSYILYRKTDLFFKQPDRNNLTLISLKCCLALPT